jgi:electron transfer flavoprotein alpha/beta subunit
VFVQVWCEVDPTLNVRVDRQTGLPAPEEGDQLRRVSPLGRAGVASALALGDAAVTAFALGGGHVEALHHALAAGAGRAVELLSPAGGPVSAAALARWLLPQGPDLVIADRLAGLVAARLGWAHLAGLDNLRIVGDVLRAVRLLDRGDREVVTARLPAAVRLQTESVRAPYVAWSRLQSATGRPLERQTLPEGAPDDQAAPLQVARARTRLGQTPAPSAAPASARLQALLGGGRQTPAPARPAQDTAATPEQMAEEFVRYLLHHHLLPQPEHPV